MTIIANPNSAHRTVSTYISGRDADGIPLVVGNQVVESWQAAAAVSQGQALCFLAPTATVPLTVTPMTAALSASHPWTFAGAALEDAAAGEMVRVCAEGFCEVLFDASDTAAFGSVVNIPYTSTGDFDIAAAPADDTLQVGVCFGIETGSTDKCLARVSRNGVGIPDENA
jgi:hypothetical protein